MNILYGAAFLALLLGYAFMFFVRICIGPLMIVMLLGPYPSVYNIHGRFAVP